MMALDLSKLILLTSVNTFKAENDVQTGSFVIGGSAPEMDTTGLVIRTYQVKLATTSDYYDIMFNGPIVIDYVYPFTLSTTRWAGPGQSTYQVIVSASGYPNYPILFELFTNISGDVLTITAISANQFLSSSGPATMTNITINYRIIPYSSTTQ